MLPQVNVGTGTPPQSQLYNTLQAGGLKTPSPLADYLRNLPLKAGDRNDDYALRHPAGRQPNSPESLAIAQQHLTAQQTIAGQPDISAVLDRLEQGDLTALSGIPQSDLEAMGLDEIAGIVRAGGEPTDFQMTATNIYNTANDIPFLRQKRWDAQKRKFITVGEWMRKERKKYNKKGRRVDRASAPAAATPTSEPANYTVQQYGVVNFNTATG